MARRCARRRVISAATELASPQNRKAVNAVRRISNVPAEAKRAASGALPYLDH